VYLHVSLGVSIDCGKFLEEVLGKSWESLGRVLENSWRILGGRYWEVGSSWRSLGEVLGRELDFIKCGSERSTARFHTSSLKGHAKPRVDALASEGTS